MRLTDSYCDSFESNFESLSESSVLTVGSSGNAIECFQWLSYYFLGEFLSMKLNDSQCDSFESDFESLSESLV